MEDADATDEELAEAYRNLAEAVNGLTVKETETSSSEQAAKTGDAAPVLIYAAAVGIALSAICAAAVLRFRRRKK